MEAILTYLEGDFIKVTYGTTSFVGESGEVYVTPKLVARAHKVQGGQWHAWDRRPNASVERLVFPDEETAKGWVAGIYLRFCLAQVLSQ